MGFNLFKGSLGKWLKQYKKQYNEFDYEEFERQRADNPLIKQLEIDRVGFARTREEQDHVYELSKKCSSLVLKYNKEIPMEDFKFFIFFKEHTAFLPLSIKPFLQPWDYVYVPGYKNIYPYPKEIRIQLNNQ